MHRNPLNDRLTIDSRRGAKAEAAKANLDLSALLPFVSGEIVSCSIVPIKDGFITLAALGALS
jgi:hypothetical protein